MTMVVNSYRVAAAGTTSDTWRLNMPQGSGNGSFGPNIWEVELRATLGGTNQCVGGTASALTSFSGAYLPANAFDGTTSGNPWAPSTTSAATWLQYVTPGIIDVAQYTVFSSLNASPKQIQLQYWDGAAWVTVHDTGNITWGTNETKTFNV